MASGLKSYRDRLYRERAHSEPEPGTVDYRDSFTRVYFSLGLFIAAEYVVETSIAVVPSGLVFPMGFLLFWAFYYTYYEPSFLEERLSFPSHANWRAVPGLLLGVLIWFMKVTLAEVRRLLRFLFIREKKRDSRVTQLAPLQSRPVARPVRLPDDVVSALDALGLEPSARWEEIQHRYRILAKQYHPDLNPEITQAGRRFMRLDTAYRRLAVVRYRYFGAKR
jgi:hypothetical protein